MTHIFSTNSDYEPKYYGKRKQTAAQKEAAMKNIKEWNRLRSDYGMEKAKRIAERKRNLKKTFSESQNMVPKSGTAAHDRFKAIIDSLPESERDRIRDGNDSEDILDVGSRWIENDDYDGEEYMDVDEVDEMLNAWRKWRAQ